MSIRNVVPPLALGAWLGVACAPAGPGTRTAEGLDDARRAAIAVEVDSATRAFQAAELARDAELAIAHLAPEFAMLLDGTRVGYDSVAASIRRTMPALAGFESEWTDLDVRVLGPDAAVASFRFRDSIVTADGEVMVTRGPTTLVWERRGSGWRIVFADADHYPIR